MTSNGTSHPGLILYEAAASSYVQKVKIALREKKIPFTIQGPPDLSTRDKSGPLRSANPRVEVPVLIDGDLQIFDSTIIVEYLEDKFPENPLLPKDPADRARARMIEEICDTEYEAINWGIGEVRWMKRAEGELAEKMERNGAHHIKVVQTWLCEKLGDKPYFGGDHFGLADAAAAPIVNRSNTLGFEPLGALKAWRERILERESVKMTFAEYEKGLAVFPMMAKAIQSGERRRQYRTQRLEWMVKAGGISVVEEGIKKDNVRFTWPDNAE